MKKLFVVTAAAALLALVSFDEASARGRGVGAASVVAVASVVAAAVVSVVSASEAVSEALLSAVVIAARLFGPVLSVVVIAVTAIVVHGSDTSARDTPVGAWLGRGAAITRTITATAIVGTLLTL